MAAKQILLVVSGEDKAEIVRKVCYGPVTPEVPASILQFHPNAIAVIDEAAWSVCAELFEGEECGCGCGGHHHDHDHDGECGCGCH